MCFNFVLSCNTFGLDQPARPIYIGLRDVSVLTGTRAAKLLPGTHQVSLKAACQSKRDFQTKGSLS